MVKSFISHTLLGPLLHVQFFFTMAMHFHEIIMLSSYIKISLFRMSCAGNATTSVNRRKLKISEYFGNFLSTN